MVLINLTVARKMSYARNLTFLQLNHVSATIPTLFFFTSDLFTRSSVPTGHGPWCGYHAPSLPSASVASAPPSVGVVLSFPSAPPIPGGLAFPSLGSGDLSILAAEREAVPNF